MKLNEILPEHLGETHKYRKRKLSDKKAGFKWQSPQAAEKVVVNDINLASSEDAT